MAFVEADFITVDGDLAAFPRGDAGLDPLVRKSFALPVSIVAAICQQVFGRRQGNERSPRTNVLAALTIRQEHAHGAARRVGHGMQLRGHPTLGPAPQAAAPPFLIPRLEAVLCVLIWVGSIISISVSPP